MFANQRKRMPLVIGGEVAVFQVLSGEALVASGVAVFEMVRGRRERWFTCTSLGAIQVAALTELL